MDWDLNFFTHGVVNILIQRVKLLKLMLAYFEINKKIRVKEPSAIDPYAFHSALQRFIIVRTQLIRTFETNETS